MVKSNIGCLMQRTALASRVGTSKPCTPGQKENQFLKLYFVFGTVDYGKTAETEY
jgi:hypothetical protein